MRWLLFAAVALGLAAAPADALVYWHGPGYYLIGCNGSSCSILHGPFVEELDCQQQAAKSREYGPGGMWKTFKCKHFEKAPDEREYFNPWKGG